MNAKMIETALGMVARFIPPDEYAKAVKAIMELVAVGQAFDDRLKDVQNAVKIIGDLQAQVATLEAIVKANVPGASAEYAARDLFMVPGTIETALAPAKEGAINGD